MSAKEYSVCKTGQSVHRIKEESMSFMSFWRNQWYNSGAGGKATVIASCVIAGGAVGSVIVLTILKFV